MRYMTPAKVFRLILLSASLLLSTVRAAADTIVLKNGRRITAINVVEEGDKVR